MPVRTNFGSQLLRYFSHKVAGTACTQGAITSPLERDFCFLET